MHDMLLYAYLPIKTKSLLIWVDVIVRVAYKRYKPRFMSSASKLSSSVVAPRSPGEVHSSEKSMDTCALTSAYLEVASKKERENQLELAAFLRHYALALPKLGLPVRPSFFSPSMLANNVRAILFDMYGTLVESQPRERINDVLAAALEVHTELVSAVYKQLTESFLVGAISPLERMRIMLSRLGKTTASEDETNYFVELERAAYIRAARLYPGVEAMIKSYRRQGYSVGIVSNASLLGIDVARHYNLVDMVDASGFSADAFIRSQKPFSAIYMSVCNQLRVTPQECLFVDDGSHNFPLEGAQVLGMTTVRVDHPGARADCPIEPLGHYRVLRIADASMR